VPAQACIGGLSAPDCSVRSRCLARRGTPASVAGPAAVHQHQRNKRIRSQAILPQETAGWQDEGETGGVGGDDDDDDDDVMLPPSHAVGARTFSGQRPRWHTIEREIVTPVVFFCVPTNSPEAEAMPVSWTASAPDAGGAGPRYAFCRHARARNRPGLPARSWPRMRGGPAALRARPSDEYHFRGTDLLGAAKPTCCRERRCEKGHRSKLEWCYDRSV